MKPLINSLSTTCRRVTSGNWRYRGAACPALRTGTITSPPPGPAACLPAREPACPPTLTAAVLPSPSSRSAGPRPSGSASPTSLRSAPLWSPPPSAQCHPLPSLLGGRSGHLPTSPSLIGCRAGWRLLTPGGGELGREGRKERGAGEARGALGRLGSRE